MRSCCREKVFGPGHAVPLDRNAKCRVLVYAAGYNARHRQPGQHIGPITRTFLDVLEALLRSFHNSRTGACFPSYEAIAAKADCDRSTVYEAIKVLEWARVLTWQNRIVRIQVRERDLFGRWADSALRSRQEGASNKRPAARPEPQNPAKEPRCRRSSGQPGSWRWPSGNAPGATITSPHRGRARSRAVRTASGEAGRRAAGFGQPTAAKSPKTRQTRMDLRLTRQPVLDRRRPADIGRSYKVSGGTISRLLP
jgi:hypothetical protein